MLLQKTGLTLAAVLYSYLAAAAVLVVLCAALGYRLPYRVSSWLTRARDILITPFGLQGNDLTWEFLSLGCVFVLSLLTVYGSVLLLRRRLLLSWFWRIVNAYVLVMSSLVLCALLCLVAMMLLMALAFAPTYLSPHHGS